jgi:hypothetical protein
VGEAVKFPDRGKTWRERVGSRLNVRLSRGRKPHGAGVYEVTYKTRERGDVRGAFVETFCVVALDFIPFDEKLRGEQIGERTEYREVEYPGAEMCGRCLSSMTAMMLGRSRKQAFRRPRSERPKAGRAETFAEVKARREREALHEKFSQACFGVSASEVKRRGIVKTGRGRGTRWGLGRPDGSDKAPA